MMPSAMIQPRLARSASIPEPRPTGDWISEALVIAVPFHVSMLMRDPVQKLITRQGAAIDLDQLGIRGRVRYRRQRSSDSSAHPSSGARGSNSSRAKGPAEF